MIQMTHVSKKYEEEAFALDQINVQIESGEFVYIIGKSGSGKSTFLKLLSGEERPTEGTIYAANHEITSITKKNLVIYRRKIGIVFQDFKLLSKKNVFENIAYRLEIMNCPPDQVQQKVQRVLEAVDLIHCAESFPTEISGGEQQRAAIARAIITQPEILLADEPTANLDLKNACRIMELFNKINRSGTTVIMAPHNATVVDRDPHRILEIDQGKMIRDQFDGKYVRI